jgi:hypothetical protein
VVFLNKDILSLNVDYKDINRISENSQIYEESQYNICAKIESELLQTRLKWLLYTLDQGNISQAYTLHFNSLSIHNPIDKALSNKLKLTLIAH